MNPPLDTPRTTVVLPARDEADRIIATLRALADIPGVEEIVVVDDASNDNTKKLSEGFGARTVRTDGRGGKGGAMLSGLALVGREFPGTEVVLFCDADLGETAGELEVLLLAAGDGARAAIAAFPASVAGGGGFGFVKRFARRGIYARTGFLAAEPLSGQRAVALGDALALPGIAPGFGAEVGMTLDLISRGVRPVEVPVDLNHRATGKTLRGFAHRARQGRDVVRALRGARLPWPDGSPPVPGGSRG